MMEFVKAYVQAPNHGATEVWECDQPEGAYLVIRESWSPDRATRTIHEVEEIGNV